LNAVRLVLTATARHEIAQANNWYKQERQELAVAFRAELDRQLSRIRQRPTQFPIADGDVRRAKLRRFPYNIFFRIIHDAIYIIACFHSARDPAAWKSRI
jgi:toxin ParE1/3/4